jgi:hypothetical protein
MKTALSLCLAACSFPVPVLAVQCGKWYSTACLAEEDKRYDEAYTNDLNKQEPLWTDLSGLWKADTTTFEADGSPIQPSHFNPVNASTSFGLPYTRDQTQSYFNHFFIRSEAFSIALSNDAKCFKPFLNDPKRSQ